MNAPAVSRLTTSSDAWGLSGLDGIEESWRDTVLWLLSGHTALFEVRGFYHHLRETCSATAAQIYTTKQTLGTTRRQLYDLLEKLKYCSPLGSLVHGIRGSLPSGQEPTVGVTTIRNWTVADRKLADEMSGYWVNLARSGDPNDQGLPAWPAFTNAERKVQYLGDPITVGGVANIHGLSVLDTVYTAVRGEPFAAR